MESYEVEGYPWVLVSDDTGYPLKDALAPFYPSGLAIEK
jgi:hypothetical protein